MSASESNSQMNYIFYLPAYQKNSNGIICLWEAAFYFSMHRNVSIVVTDNLLTKIPNKFSKIKIFYNLERFISKSNHKNVEHTSNIPKGNEIIEIRPDDPHNLMTKSTNKIVRYLMCRSLVLSPKELDVDKNNYVLSYSNAVSTVFPSYLIINENLLQISNSVEKAKKKNKALIYYGKTRYGLCFKNLNEIAKQFEEYEIIHRLYPDNNRDLYKKIAESSLFISLDPLTSLMHESTLIGTPAYVYDQAFKKFYDNFDFKLHGFYYDLKPSDLKDIDIESKNLSEKTNETARKFMSDINERTIITIESIENYFDSKISNINNINEAKEEDLNFFKNIWKIPTIFNCISFKTIERYHLVNKYKILSIALLMIRRIFLKVLNILFLNHMVDEEKIILKNYLFINNIKKNKSSKEINKKISKNWK